MSKDACDMSAWYSGQVQQASRTIFQRKLYGGEPMDNSAEELYGEHIELLCEAFAKANTAEAAVRKLALKTTWRAAGRSGEASHVSYNGIRYNILFGTLVIDSPQPKANKVKHVPYVAGRTRHMDWALDYGDHLVWMGSRLKWQSDGRNLIMPELGGGEKHGRKAHKRAGEWRHPPMSDTQRPHRALRTTQRAAAQRSRAALLSWEPKQRETVMRRISLHMHATATS